MNSGRSWHWMLCTIVSVGVVAFCSLNKGMKALSATVSSHLVHIFTVSLWIENEMCLMETRILVFGPVHCCLLIHDMFMRSY
jgi:hypothetical protein